MERRHALIANHQSYEERLSHDFIKCDDYRMTSNGGADFVKFGRRQLGMTAHGVAPASGIYLVLDWWILNNVLQAGQILSAIELN